MRMLAYDQQVSFNSNIALRQFTQRLGKWLLGMPKLREASLLEKGMKTQEKDTRLEEGEEFCSGAEGHCMVFETLSSLE